jgi:hypothetical protein
VSSNDLFWCTEICQELLEIIFSSLRLVLSSGERAFLCSTVFYGQYKCFGPGANQANRAAWSHELTDAQAAPFMSLGYIDGSLWVTGE